MLERNWHPLADPATPAEAEALNTVRSLIPDDAMWHAWSNLSFPDRSGHINEIDVMLLAPRGLFLIELKGWHGDVTGRINKWSVRPRGGREDVRTNPVNETDKKAKRLKGLLESEKLPGRDTVRLPYVVPVVVMHGRGSRVELSDSTTSEVYGLDGFDVTGVPPFSELLKSRGRFGDLIKPDIDALLRLLDRSGLAPRQQHSPATPAPISPSTPVESTDLDGPRGPIEAVKPDEPIDPVQLVDDDRPVFDELTEVELRELGVDDDCVAAVRAAFSIESLIGVVADALWDDLEAVAGGEAVGDVVIRRRAAHEVLASVDEEAALVGWTTPITDEIPAGDHSEQPSSGETTHDDVPAALPADLVQKLLNAYGDSVTVRTPKKRPAVPRRAPKPSPQARTTSSDPTVPAEALLGIARTEAMAGRLDGATRLHERVLARLDDAYTLDWTLDEVLDLSRSLGRDLMLALRLEQLVTDLREGTPRAPQLMGNPTTEVGALWDGDTLGPAYSLLVRVPDVLDRRSGLFLSQVIGRSAAEEVNQRLRAGRPDGGRIRIAGDGTVLSRRDASSPWFVVGHVSPHEWYPAEQVLDRSAGRMTSHEGIRRQLESAR